MNAETRQALASLRKATGLRAKIEALQEQLDLIESDQFTFSPEAWQCALERIQADLEARGQLRIDRDTGEITGDGTTLDWSLGNTP